MLGTIPEKQKTFSINNISKQHRKHLASREACKFYSNNFPKNDAIAKL